VGADVKGAVPNGGRGAVVQGGGHGVAHRVREAVHSPRRGSGACRRLTSACSRRLTASARTSLRLPGAAEAQRSAACSRYCFFVRVML